MSRSRILVIGGYGAVGRHTVEHLARNSDALVTIGGRSEAKARQLATDVGGAVDAIMVDASDHHALGKIVPQFEAIVCCTEYFALEVANASIAHGRHMVTIAADAAVMRRLSQEHERARASGTKIVAGVGLAPGVTSLLARHLASKLDLNELLLLVELSAFDRHGAEAIAWVFEQAATAEPGVALRLPGGNRFAIPMAFGDTDALAFKLGLTMVVSFLALRPDWATRALRPTAQIMHRVRRRHDRLYSALCRFLAQAGRARASFRVGAFADSGDTMIGAWIEGRGQSRVTGVVASLVAQQLLNTSSGPGVLDIDDLLRWQELLPCLEALGCKYRTFPQLACIDRERADLFAKVTTSGPG